MPVMIPVLPGTGKGEGMYEKPSRPWTGIAPSAAALSQLDYEEMSVLALLSWCSVTNRPVTSADLATIKDRDGTPLGIEEAREIVRNLTEMRIMSVLGMANARPLSVLLGGFQPRSGARRPGAPFRTAAPHAAPPSRKPGQRPGRNQAPAYKWVFKNRRVETGLEMSPGTPSFVMPEAERLRKAQLDIEQGLHGDDLVAAANGRLGVLKSRIALYERWLRNEPGHPTLAKVLEKKRNAVPELEFQVERAQVKQAELEKEKSDAV